jgi:hypothetical protein
VKFALTTFPERYSLPGRPSASASAIDAHKQTQFLLSEELAVFERAMNLQLAMVGQNKKARTPSAAAILSSWSRAFSHLADACTLVCSGSYGSCPPLLRTALDNVAVQRSLLRDGFAEYEEWFEGAAAQAPEYQALAFSLGRYRAGSVLAEDVRLGALYRLLTDLSMPHFGSTALQVGAESGLQRLTVAFADQAFHLGWAQLVLGWLLTLAAAQIEIVIETDALTITQQERDDAVTVAADIKRQLSDSRRCHVEEVDGRFLFHNFRRTASGQPKRIML